MRTEMGIKRKLLTGFGITIFASAVVAVTALSGLSVGRGELENRLTQMKAVAELEAASSASVQRVAAGANGSTPASASTVEKGEIRAMEQLKGSLTSEREQALFQALSAKMSSFASSRAKTSAMVNQGRKAEAVKGLKLLREKQVDYQGSLTGFGNYLAQQAQLERVAAAAKATRARVATISLLFLAVGVVAGVAYWLVKSIIKPLADAIETADRIAERDLTVQVCAGDGSEAGHLMTAMGNMVQNLRGIVSQTSGISTSIATSSTQLHQTSEQIASGAEQVASQAQTVATASEQMSATSNDIAQSCHAAARNAMQASNAAETGAQVVAQTVEVMNRIADRVNATSRTVESLGERSDQIGAIVGTIEDIADQTNLLALNAAIEAARAGEQGRGFAVVADEVRALSERTAKATREISEMIKAIQAETRGAVQAMEEGVREVQQGTEEAAKSGSALQEILDQINAVSMQVNQIATAAEEQTATISEISGNITRMTEVVQRTAQGSQDSSIAAAQLASLSDDLSTLVTQFKLN
ncbi:Methyl-accepting chemotaxis sensor/transducer protein [Citrifermentans bremense]|uniref:Methyl-accepting chemotaxis sensor/transducer protein n=1 Tax=Citrifermentans bremense TaxID=60035 RepID=A0A6S6LZ34_9BACT|nr:HAMP domain-containing methyl-accepting chemotaxis protein [Citrifermentans bremense]BCG47357.1 Methyl-accepting chemotaxis sensor/transducer protein [Citrifermentans bremense]